MNSSHLAAFADRYFDLKIPFRQNDVGEFARCRFRRNGQFVCDFTRDSQLHGRVKGACAKSARHVVRLFCS